MPPRRKRSKLEPAQVAKQGSQVDVPPIAFEELGGDLVLECSSGEQVKAFSQILRLTSPVLEAALNAPNAAGNLQVEGSKEAWHHLLTRLYPTFPRPDITLESAYVMLPLAHQYKMDSVTAEVCAQLSHQLPQQLTSDPNCPRYVFKWLKLADDLQLDTLRKLCMSKIRTMALDRDKQLQQALIANVPNKQRRIKAQATPAKPPHCPLYGAFYFNPGHTHCIAWCLACKAWVCSNPPAPIRPGCCQTCQQPVAAEPGSALARWFPSDEPELLGAIKGLSRSTVDELLASMVVVCSGDCSKYEPASA